MRDGYAELLQGRDSFNIIVKKRVDNAIQVAQIKVKNSSQTTFTFPVNAWTQYEYHVDINEPIPDKVATTLSTFFQARFEEVNDRLYVNGSLNLYTNDYKDLKLDDRFAKATDGRGLQEYISFTDIQLCKDLMITSVAWHPTLTGVLAITYSYTSTNNVIDKTPGKVELAKKSTRINPVLIWSFVDALKPKLILESYRATICSSFCPYDENLLIGK